MSFVSATIGRFSPRYKTFSEFIPVYQETLNARGLSDKTLANHSVALRQLNSAIGKQIISKVKPHSIAQATRELHLKHPHAAQRLLSEARAVFAEAVALGWSYSNPAAEVRMPVAKIKRERLTLEDWNKIVTYAKAEMPAWVSRMLVLALVTGLRRGDLARLQFDDVRDVYPEGPDGPKTQYLQICLQKTGTLLRLPLSLRLEAVNVSIEEAIADCQGYSKGNVFLLRKSTGAQLSPDSLSARFETAREAVLGKHSGDGAPPSLHECRSLAERLYREQGVDTQKLLGHAHQKMTDVYNSDRGLTGGKWRTLEL